MTYNHRQNYLILMSMYITLYNCYLFSHIYCLLCEIRDELDICLYNVII